MKRKRKYMYRLLLFQIKYLLYYFCKRKKKNLFSGDKSGVKTNKDESHSVVTNDVGLSFTKTSSTAHLLRPTNVSGSVEGINTGKPLSKKIFTFNSDVDSTCSQESLTDALRTQNCSSIANNTYHSFEDNSELQNSNMTTNASPPCFPRNLSSSCIAEEEGQTEDTSDNFSLRNSVTFDSLPSGKPPVPAAMLRKQRAGLHRSHTWTACDVPFDRQFPLKRKSDGLRQGLLTRRHKQSISLQNVFCMVKETSINSVRTLIKLFEMNVVRILMF